MRAWVIGAAALLALACSKKQAAPEPPARTADQADQDESEESRMGPKIESEEVSYQAGDTTLKGYIAWDASKEGPRPGVIVVHEWWGHTDYVRKRANMLAELGYTALALDMYGDGRVADHPEDAMKFMQETISNVDVAKERFAAAYELLKEHETTNPNDIAAIGYCFGGATVMQMAYAGLDVDAVASFHGSLPTPAQDAPPDIKARILVAHGNADPFVPAEKVSAFRQALEAAGADWTMIEFGGVKHSFTNPSAGDYGIEALAYDEQADKQSWQMLIWLLQDTFR